MKNFLYLEPDEEIPSIIKKLKKHKSKAIDLVVPLGSVMFAEDNLELIKDESEKLNQRLTIHSNDSAGLILSKKMGIEIAARSDVLTEKEILSQKSNHIKIIYKKGANQISAKTTPKITKVTSEKSDKQDLISQSKSTPPSKPNIINQIIFYLVFIVSILIIIFVFLYIVPETSIQITTQAKTTPFQGDVTLDIKQKNIDPINNILPAQIINLEETVEIEARSTGQTNHGQKAGSTITVFNQTSSPIPLVGGTRFVNKDNFLFRSTNSVNIPANGSANVSVVSDIVGTKGNIGPSRFTLPALEGSEVIYGQSSQSMSGGTDEITYSVTEEDIKYSTQELSQKLFDKALDDLKTKLPKGKKYLAPELSQLNLDVKADHQVGDEVETFKIIAKSTITFLIYDQKQLQDLVGKNLSKNISKDRTFVADNSDNIAVKLVNIDNQNNKATINITTTAINTPIYNIEVIKSNIAGKTEEEVKEYFLNYPEIQQIDVRFWPEWSKRVSKIPARININIISK